MNRLQLLSEICYYIKEFNKIEDLATKTNNNNLFFRYLIELTKFEISSKLVNINNDTLMHNLQYLNRIKEGIKIGDLHIDDKNILYNISFNIEKNMFEKIIYNNNNGLYI